MSSADGERLRRQVYELTVSDLACFPSWQFALDEEGISGQDEATVRPYLRTPADAGDGLMVVRARFTLADSTEVVGFVYPPPPNQAIVPIPGQVWDLRLLQPVIVVDGGQIGLYFGMRLPPNEEIQRLRNMLGKTADQVFPLTYESDVELVGAPVAGMIGGFSCLKDGNVELITI